MKKSSKDLISIFKKNNIEEIVAIDKKLDPNFHQTMIIFGHCRNDWQYPL